MTSPIAFSASAQRTRDSVTRLNAIHAQVLADIDAQQSRAAHYTRLFLLVWMSIVGFLLITGLA